MSSDSVSIPSLSPSSNIWNTLSIVIPSLFSMYAAMCFKVYSSTSARMAFLL